MRDFLIKNLTSVTLELSQANTETKPVFSGSLNELHMTMISWWHGHSEIGSFVITRRYEEIKFKCWGNLNLKIVQDGKSTIFEIVEKNSSE